MEGDANPTRSVPARRRWAARLATLSGNLYLVLGTLVMATLALVLGWIPPRGNSVFRVARWWSRGLLAASGVRLRSSFEQPLDPDGRYIFMCNHQSLFDIPALIASLPVQTRFLAKRSLFWIPLFGWAIKLGGFISIDRRDRSRAGDSFTSAVERLRSGASTLVFPEGTRSLDGELLDFQRGGFLLALKSGQPIVPVGIRGSLQVRARGSLSIRPGTVSLRYGEPLPVAPYGLRRKGELMAEVRGRIAALAGLEDDGRRAGDHPLR